MSVAMSPGAARLVRLQRRCPGGASGRLTPAVSRRRRQSGSPHPAVPGAGQPLHVSSDWSSQYGPNVIASEQSTWSHVWVLHPWVWQPDKVWQPSEHVFSGHVASGATVSCSAAGPEGRASAVLVPRRQIPQLSRTSGESDVEVELIVHREHGHPHVHRTFKRNPCRS